MKEKTITVQRVAAKAEEGLYLMVPFSVPEEAASMELSYEYDRKNNIIDFGLLNETGELIGWSGSNRNQIFLSDGRSSDGFASVPIRQGEWNILLGAYQIQEQGVEITYKVTFHVKGMRLLKGDTHLHSTGSDGNMSVEELALGAEREGLDFLFVTDHNNYAHNNWLRSTEQVTMIPGVEWTHYKGHMGMLGRKRPFRSFLSNSLGRTVEILKEAGDSGAFRVINHPFCRWCGWKWGLEQVPFDGVEVWNGGLEPESNQDCLSWWDERLKEGKKIPITGGSDFHKYEPGRMPASPCTCVYAMSNSAEDILEGLKKGHSYLSISPEGPMMEAWAGDRLMGDDIHRGFIIRFTFWNLKKGDVISLVSKERREEIPCDSDRLSMERKAGEPGYLRVEIRRSLIPGYPQTTVLLSNPFYITGDKVERKNVF
ncbi:CehA/McbA family metallohydrolase [Lacrimispora saccharolytica]|uniref:PHP domain protein n=1 Tax=Lacrimispora saccharolytica (strain ATCC 35040 / DSM 2544 / NRCC 2533 / WM1) TaxID=610130 RepID=D9R8K9_LACSW|nr:CehA/McbA family metallohydrolase [Lacrimispora saccharolytica]ADL05738.1 PHP domain protein [[Clostridium] saccharolyticum WM1]QRV20119.1 CehA/McbA family metallohydrolase [Lacrimispora saccharolytica]